MAERTPKEPKKSDTLQIRIPHDTKQEFLAACRDDRVSASDVLRRSILDYLSFRKRPSPQQKGLLLMIPKPIRHKRVLAAGAAVFGLATFAALPSAADPDFRSSFDRLDRNGDGKLEFSEYSNSALADVSYYLDAKTQDADPPKDVAIYWPSLPGAAPSEPVKATPPLPEEQQKAFDARQAADNAADFVKADYDRDKVVTYAEFEATYLGMLKAGYALLDVNGDGAIVQDELNRGFEISMREVIVRKDAQGDLAIEAFDRNKDGAVSFDEFIPRDR